MLPEVSQRAAKAQRFIEGFLNEGAPRGPFHHRRGDIERGKDAVLRGCGDVHHEGLVEAITIQLTLLTVEYMNH